MVDHLIRLLWRLGHWGYLIIFLGAGLESAAFVGFLIPGETLVVVAGVLASLGILDLGDVIVIVAIGAILGDSVSYYLGRRLGHPWLVRYGGRVGLNQARLDRVDSFYDRHGGAAVVMGRFVGFFRALVPFVAGAARMPYPRFLCYNAVAATLWATAITLFGYFVGGSWELIQRRVGNGGLVVLCILVGVVTLVWLGRRLRRHVSS